MLANNEWGSAIGSVPDYAPIIFAVQRDESEPPTIELTSGSEIDVAFDTTLYLSTGETISAAQWNCDISTLTIKQSAVNGNLCAARIMSSMAPGDVAYLAAMMPTSFGRVIIRAIRIVSR